MRGELMGTALVIGTVLALGMPRVGYSQEPQQAKPLAQEKEELAKEAEPKVSIVQAIRTALDNVPGRAHEVDLIEKESKLIWAVEIITPDDRHFIVNVDSATRAVTSIEEKTIEKLAGDPLKGRVIYERHCVSCHGAEGKGLGSMGPLLIPPAANFSAPMSRTKSDAELLKTIQEGRPGTAMRSFKKWLSKQEMRDVLAYVRFLSHR